MVQLSYMGKRKENYFVNSWEWVIFSALAWAVGALVKTFLREIFFLFRIWFAAEEIILQTEFAFLEKKKEINSWNKMFCRQTHENWKHLNQKHCMTLSCCLMLLTEMQKYYFCVPPCNASWPCQSYSLRRALIYGTAWRMQGVGAVPLKKKE